MGWPDSGGKNEITIERRPKSGRAASEGRRSGQTDIPTKQLFLFFCSTLVMLLTLHTENLLLLSLSPDVALAYMM